MIDVLCPWIRVSNEANAISAENFSVASVACQIHFNRNVKIELSIIPLSFQILIVAERI